jgi:hypothetical protein
MTRTHLSQNPAPTTPPSGEPSRLLAAIARILTLRQTAGRPDPAAAELPQNDNASPGVEWALQIMN